jgi:hypothetical protein
MAAAMTFLPVAEYVTSRRHAGERRERSKIMVGAVVKVCLTQEM